MRIVEEWCEKKLRELRTIRRELQCIGDALRTSAEHKREMETSELRKGSEGEISFSSMMGKSTRSRSGIGVKVLRVVTLMHEDV